MNLIGNLSFLKNLYIYKISLAFEKFYAFFKINAIVAKKLKNA